MKEWYCINAVRLLSLSMSGYFLYVFHTHVGFPPHKDITSTSLTYLILFIFFLLLPLAKKLKIGDFLEYEAKVEEIKTEVKEFKEETRQVLSVQNSLINTVSNTLNQNININLPSLNEAVEAKEALSETLDQTDEPVTIEDEINDYVASEGSNINLALAKLRMDIEKELRRLLGKRTITSDPLNLKQQFLSARSLFSMFTDKHPKYKKMSGSFDYILKVCNAGIHGQNISQGHAHEALYMGLRMLDEIKRIDKELI